MRCHALDEQGLYWFEEPTTYDNIPGYAQLARELKTPVQLGIPMPTHLYPEIAAHLMRITDTAHWLEWQDRAKFAL